MLIDLHGGPFVTIREDESLFTAGARATLRLGTDDCEYIWTAGFAWSCPVTLTTREWYADASVSDHTAYVQLLGFRFYATWW